ncbi:MAG: hypothetical protein IJ548_02640 [Paludibacteraceae bacterium]|nr:hypothetical protein [Paludibacteraceae bacterium]MBQ8705184.1 hypothetical protein [Paludibacteraceae bacterium]
MKKVLLILVGIVCTLSASALSYASPYKGAGRNGYIHTSAPMRSSMGTRAVMAQAPIAAMSSTSSYGMQSASYGRVEDSSSDKQVRGIYTAASAIQGGVTTYDTAQRNVPGRRKTESVPGKPGECHCVDLDDNGYCDHCGAEIDEFDGGCSNDPCWCPLELNWSVMLFFASLAGAYAVYKKRTSTVQ